MSKIVLFFKTLQQSLILSIIEVVLFFLFFFIALNAGNTTQRTLVCIGMAVFALFILLESLRAYQRIRSSR